MKFVQRAKIAYIVGASLMIALGLLLIVYPRLGLDVVCYIVGSFVVLFGAVKIVGYLSGDLNRPAYQFDLALGIFAVILGIVIIAHPGAVASALPYIYGVYAIIDGVSKLQTAIDVKRLGFKNWWTLIIFAAVTCVAGLLLIMNPFEGLEALMILLGISLLCDGAENLCTVIYTVRVGKKAEKAKKRAADMTYNAIEMDDGTEFKQ